MRRFLLVLVAVLTLGAATVALAGTGKDGDRRGHDGKRHHRVAMAKLINADRERVGRVWLKERRRDGGVLVFARVRDLPPGFHGFHIHTTGRCDPPTFMSAGGHYNPTGATHRDHAGDLPTLLVNRDGKGLLVAETDRFSISDLRAGDGSAVMVHELADNYANIPARYGGPDAATLDTGDSGSRIACGVVR